MFGYLWVPSHSRKPERRRLEHAADAKNARILSSRCEFELPRALKKPPFGAVVIAPSRSGCKCCTTMSGYFRVGTPCGKSALPCKQASNGAHGVILSQNPTTPSKFSLKPWKFRKNRTALVVHRTKTSKGVIYKIQRNWISYYLWMFYISCVLVPRIAISHGYMVQNRGGFNISHGFLVTWHFLLEDSGFNPAEDMQHDQHSGR